MNWKAKTQVQAGVGTFLFATTFSLSGVHLPSYPIGDNDSPG
jgi:hypothetical protein